MTSSEQSFPQDPTSPYHHTGGQASADEFRGHTVQPTVGDKRHKICHLCILLDSLSLRCSEESYSVSKDLAAWLRVTLESVFI